MSRTSARRLGPAGVIEDIKHFGHDNGQFAWTPICRSVRHAASCNHQGCCMVSLVLGAGDS
jgi:hypothetical protein